MAYTQILYHIVLRTKRSEQSIAQENVSSLYKYIWGIIKNKKGNLYRINGMEDHIHHQKENTQNELKRLWKENGMEPDERYFA